MCCRVCNGKITAFASSDGGAYEGCENTYGTTSHDSWYKSQLKEAQGLLKAVTNADEDLFDVLDDIDAYLEEK